MVIRKFESSQVGREYRGREIAAEKKSVAAELLRMKTRRLEGSQVTVLGPVADGKMLSSTLPLVSGSVAVAEGTSSAGVMKLAVDSVRGGTAGEWVKHLGDEQVGTLLRRNSPELGALAISGKPVAAQTNIPVNLSAVDAAVGHLQSELGKTPLAGKRFAVVTGNDFIPSEMREYSVMLEGLGAKVDFVTDGAKTLRSDLNQGTSIQQLNVTKDLREVSKNLNDYSGVIVAANYTSKNQSGGAMKKNPLFKLVDDVMKRGDIALGLNCHALWGLMGAKAISQSPALYKDLTLTFNTVLEPEARALGYKDARPRNIDMHHFAVTDPKRPIVSSSAGVETGTVRLVEQMVKEVVRLKGNSSATAPSGYEDVAAVKGSPTLMPTSGTPVSQRLMLGKEERELVKTPAVNDPRHFDAPYDAAAADALVTSLRARLNHGDKPLAGKKVAVAVEALFDPAELREYSHVLGALGADVVYTSRISWGDWAPGVGTFESAPQSETVHRLSVTHDLKDVAANMGEYSALILPDGNGSKRLSFHLDNEQYEETPFFKAVSAALNSPSTKVAVNGRGMWGLLGASNLPEQQGTLRDAVVAASAEMLPEALAFASPGSRRVASRPRVDAKNGIISSPSQSLPMVEQLALELAKQG